jgi:hypothetical protein
MLGDVGFCGTPGVEYDEMLARLAGEQGLHVTFPLQRDYHSAPGSSLRRAIAEFEDLARGGDGAWTIPGRVPDREQWW